MRATKTPPELASAQEMIERAAPPGSTVTHPFAGGDGCYVIFLGDRKIGTVSAEYNGYRSLRGGFRAWRFTGPYVVGGRTSYSGGYFERKTLAELLQVVAPMMRGAKPSEEARDRTTAARYSWGINHRNTEPQIAHFAGWLYEAIMALPTIDDYPEAAKWARAYSEWAIAEAAASGIREMWGEFDDMIAQRERVNT